MIYTLAHNTSSKSNLSNIYLFVIFIFGLLLLCRFFNSITFKNTKLYNSLTRYNQSIKRSFKHLSRSIKNK
jgi:hypothetical protein